MACRIALEIQWKGDFHIVRKFWPTSSTSFYTQKIVLRPQNEEKWVLIKYGCVIHYWKKPWEEDVKSP